MPELTSLCCWSFICQTWIAVLPSRGRGEHEVRSHTQGGCRCVWPITGSQERPVVCLLLGSLPAFSLCYWGKKNQTLSMWFGGLYRYGLFLRTTTKTFCVYEVEPLTHNLHKFGDVDPSKKLNRSLAFWFVFSWVMGVLHETFLHRKDTHFSQLTKTNEELKQMGLFRGNFSLVSTQTCTGNSEWWTELLLWAETGLRADAGVCQ